MSVRRTLASLSLVLMLPLSAWGQSSFQQADTLVREGEFTQALAVANAEQDPLQRAQARLHVYYYAGDLDAALACGREGLAVDPREPWLLQQAAAVALSLGVGRPASEWLSRLEEVNPGQTPPWMLERAGELRALREGEGAALSRARGVAITLLSLLLLGMLYGVFGKAGDENTTI